MEALFQPRFEHTELDSLAYLLVEFLGADAGPLLSFQYKITSEQPSKLKQCDFVNARSRRNLHSLIATQDK